MKMTVGKLIRDLQDYDEDLPVRLMMQPNYPFEYSIGGLVERSEFDSNTDDVTDPRERSKNCVFLLEGSQLQYGSKRAWDPV